MCLPGRVAKVVGSLWLLLLLLMLMLLMLLLLLLLLNLLLRGMSNTSVSVLACRHGTRTGRTTIGHPHLGRKEHLGALPLFLSHLLSVDVLQRSKMMNEGWPEHLPARNWVGIEGQLEQKWDARELLKLGQLRDAIATQV